MSEGIVVALLSLAGTCLGTIGGIIASSKIDSFIGWNNLKRRLDKHNSVIERTYQLEKRG